MVLHAGDLQNSFVAITNLKKSMKNLSKSKFLKFPVAPCLCLLMLVTSCSKDNDEQPETGSSYPKEVNIEYRITSTTGLATADILYVNETGGRTSVDNVSLPYSLKFKRTVNSLDNAAISFSKSASGTAKSEILVEDKVVKTETFSGTSYISGTILYLFQ